MKHVRRAPDLVGPTGRAWEMDVSIDKRPDASGCLAQWVVNGPWHPFWSYWVVAVIHLRPIPGVKPPTLQMPGASHEFLIMSLQSPPSDPLEPDPDVLETLRPLQPADLVHQEIGLTDEQARQICASIVRSAVEAGWSLYSDYRRSWEGVLAKTAEHYRLSGHPEDGS